MRKQKPSMKGSNQIVSKLLRPKQPENKPSGPKKAKGPIVLEARREKKNILMEKKLFDFSRVPLPGVRRVVQVGDAGDWQSSCCTIMYRNILFL
ncbi:hypothetical protein ES319_A08G162700v1 [Gossypium barbadense]|uniref:Uncharacterized protein n=2 Tax=Gossypium TaxID=3633 RepID=A0ABR0P4C5_GOSAR|nr:hypothetical protein ES319_A08G162700v1 [Gossypium barbadense]KAK5812904.1 hypothetical protein PVK06_028348 [Gossypium arboreum]